jgi:hypothetical protein
VTVILDFLLFFFMWLENWWPVGSQSQGESGEGKTPHPPQQTLIAFMQK